MEQPATSSDRIAAVVSAWLGVEVHEGQFGLAFTLGKRELGHLHGERVAHFAFPRALRAELLEQGRVVPHPVDSPGLAARALASEDDVAGVVELLRLNYDRIVERHGVPAPG